jgi:N-acetylated-alpha-linked acidic dipeptidase
MSIALGVEQPDYKTTSQVNKMLLTSERAWLSAEGVPGRPWFKHQLYGTRFTYAHLELPGLTEAVETQNWDVARQQVRLITESVTRSIALVKEAQMDLNRALASRSKP